MATIQLRRRIVGGQIAPPASANQGEPFFSLPGFTGGGTNALYIDNGTNVVALVDSTRQVELTGAQTVTGIKTFSGAGGVALAGVANLTLGDGTTGQVLVKGLGTAMGWGSPAAASVITDNVTIGGDGLVASPITLLPAIFTTGLTWAPNTVRVTQATQLVFGGGMIATPALIAAGADDATIVSPLGLRGELGAAASTLNTTAKTVVPAINELLSGVTALVGVLVFAGSYDATTSTATYNGQGGIAAGTGPLPPATAANHGAYLIVNVAGPGGGVNEPAGPIHVQDWLISDGTTWTLLHFDQVAMLAANVAVSPLVAGADDVQEALTNIDAKASAPGFYNPLTFSGDALAVATQLDLILADGGTF